jgi:hypothetical protein
VAATLGGISFLSDFIEEPFEPELPEVSKAPPRLIGLHPTAEPPRKPGKAAAPSCTGPCEGCGVQVLQGATSTGKRLIVDLGIPTYVATWTTGTRLPTLAESRAYPVHRCVQKGEDGAEPLHGN